MNEKYDINLRKIPEGLKSKQIFNENVGIF